MIGMDFAVAATAETLALDDAVLAVVVVVGWRVHGPQGSHCHCCCCYHSLLLLRNVYSEQQTVAVAVVDFPASSGVAAVVGGCSCHCIAVAVVVGHGSSVVDDCAPDRMLLGCAAALD